MDPSAAEGITVVVAAGDSGSAGCDQPGPKTAATQRLAVNGDSSTPFNISVGGSDFGNPFPFIKATSDPTTQNSAVSYIPEIIWNDSCARSGNITGCYISVSPYGQDLVAGGRGGGGGGGVPGPPSDPGTPVGSYTVTVTGTSGSLTHSLSWTLTVHRR